MESTEVDSQVVDIDAYQMLSFINNQYTLVPQDGGGVAIIGKKGVRYDFEKWVRETVNGMLSEPPEIKVRVVQRVLEELDAKYRAPVQTIVPLYQRPPDIEPLDLNTAKAVIRTSAKVVVRNGLYIWTGGYKARHLAKAAGFRYNSIYRQWWTREDFIARKLFEYADYEARVKMGSPVVHPLMDEVNTALVQSAVRYLAGVCDWAKDLDHQGYSKSDAYVGHKLAELGALNANQATLGLRLVIRHKRQLPEWLLDGIKSLIDLPATIV